MRFPLPLVYRVLDIVFVSPSNYLAGLHPTLTMQAEGIEAVFRFALAILQREEDRLVTLEFEEILAALQDVFERYREGDDWRANEFVQDAYEIRM